MSILKKILFLNIIVLTIIIGINQNDEKTGPTREVSSIVKGPVGEVIQIKGNVYNQDSIKLELGDSINELDILVTKRRSMVKIQFKDESVLMMGPSSKTYIQKFNYRNNNNRDVTISLVKGWIRTLFKHKNKRGLIQVRTKTAAMGVRGTEFITQYNNKKTEMILIHGKVDFLVSKKNIVKRILPNTYISWDNNDIIIKDIESKKVKNLENIFLTKEDKFPELVYEKSSFTIPVEKKLNTKDQGETKDSIDGSNNKKSVYNRIEKKERGISSVPEKKIGKSLSNDEALKKMADKKEIKKDLDEFKDRMFKYEEEWKNRRISEDNITDIVEKTNEVSDIVEDYIRENIEDTSLKDDFLNIDDIENLTENTESNEIIKQEIVEAYLKKEELFSDIINNMVNQKKAYPLVYPDGQVVFFRDYPELKKFLSYDGQGRVIGINVDRTGNIIGDYKVLSSENFDNLGVAKDSSGNILKIPVIDNNGEVIYIYPIDNNNNAVTLKMNRNGVSISVLKENLRNILENNVVEPAGDVLEGLGIGGK